MSILKEALCLALAAALTWLILQVPAPAQGAAAPAPGSLDSGTSTVVSLRPMSETAVEVASAPMEPKPESPESPESAEQRMPPPAELGSREGLADVAASALGQPDVAESLESEPSSEHAEVIDEEPPQEPRESAKDLAQDRELIAAAEVELSGEHQASLGFSTVLVSSPEDQLDIARAFSEEIVLVPKAALGVETDSNVHSFRLLARGKGTPRVEVITGRPDLSHARQYRDLFAYEFRRLSPALREFRSRLPRRDEVFLFAALIPASEWAVVIGRRREALAATGIELESVERFVLRYVRAKGGTFDFVVDAIHLAGGQTILPPNGLR